MKLRCDWARRFYRKPFILRYAAMSPCDCCKLAKIKFLFILGWSERRKLERHFNWILEISSKANREKNVTFLHWIGFIYFHEFDLLQPVVWYTQTRHFSWISFSHRKKMFSHFSFEPISCFVHLFVVGWHMHLHVQSVFIFLQKKNSKQCKRKILSKKIYASYKMYLFFECVVYDCRMIVAAKCSVEIMKMRRLDLREAWKFGNFTIFFFSLHNWAYAYAST